MSSVHGQSAKHIVLFLAGTPRQLAITGPSYNGELDLGNVESIILLDAKGGDGGHGGRGGNGGNGYFFLLFYFYNYYL